MVAFLRLRAAYFLLRVLFSRRHEFLHHYLGRGTIFSKAKRSLTSSFDHLLKRKASKDDFGVLAKELSLPPRTTAVKEPSLPSSASSSDLTDENRTKNAVTIITVPPSSNEENLEESNSSSECTSPHKVLNSPKSMREM